MEGVDSGVASDEASGAGGVSDSVEGVTAVDSSVDEDDDSW